MENNFDEDYENDFQFKEFLNKYAIHWQWFALAVSICMIFAFVYLRYTIPQ